MQPEPVAPRAEGSVPCPACGSAKCKEAAWAWAQFDGDNPAERPAWTQNDTSPSVIAKRCAKPKAPSPGMFLSAVGFAIGLGAAYLVVTRTGSEWLAVAAFVLLQVLGYFVWHKLIGAARMPKYEARLQAWKNSYLCMACGHLFVAGDNAA